MEPNIEITGRIINENYKFPPGQSKLKVKSGSETYIDIAKPREEPYGVGKKVRISGFLVPGRIKIISNPEIEVE